MISSAVRRGFCGLVLAAAGLAGAVSDEDAAFFETRVRPVLAEQCWSCHGSKIQQAGLRLDSREAALAGGGRGPAVIPGDPGASVLLRALRHEGPQMPLGGKLSTGKIADFAKWIENGAVWPSTEEPDADAASNRRARPETLGVPAGRNRRAPGGPGRSLGAERSRRVHPRQAGRGRLSAGASS